MPVAYLSIYTICRKVCHLIFYILLMNMCVRWLYVIKQMDSQIKQHLHPTAFSSVTFSLWGMVLLNLFINKPCIITLYADHPKTYWCACVSLSVWLLSTCVSMPSCYTLGDGFMLSWARPFNTLAWSQLMSFHDQILITGKTKLSS